MWTVEARTAVGPLTIGMTAAQFADILGKEDKTFRRPPTSDDLIYVYDAELVHLTCNGDGAVKIISVFRPKEVFFSEVLLLGRDIEQVVSELKSKGIGAEKEDAGYWVDAAGVLLVEVDGTVDGIELYSE
jgi:hypothetical protein